MPQLSDPTLAPATASARLDRAHAAGAAAAPARNAVLNERQADVVLGALLDRTRLCPVLAGAARVKGERLSVRTASREIDVRAPARLLDLVFERCDGTQTLEEILFREPPARRSEYEAFISFLLGEGALIDASLATVEAAGFAHQGTPFGLEAPAKTTNHVSLRFFWNQAGAATEAPTTARRVESSPLDAFFASRVSTYTFDDRPLPPSAMDSLLWSLAGVVRLRHERMNYVTPQRTIASAGGMHLLTLYVALHRAVGAHAPGVYRVRYPDERTISLEAVSEDHGLLPRAFIKPWELTYATGAVFVCADPRIAALRYRNRGLQYLFMEAGAALQNGGLSAPQLGIGFAVIGGYHESTVARMCRLEHEVVLGSAIFGPAPTAQQLSDVQRAAEFEFAWVEGTSRDYAMPSHLARASVKSYDNDRPLTWGRDRDPWLACRKALAESIEREGFRQPRRIVEGTMSQVQGALDPRDFVAYAASQYRSSGFPYETFDPDRPQFWTEGVDLASGKPVRVLAELVFSRTSLLAERFALGRPCTQMTSSGCAAGTDRDDATQRALLEVIERDAFMRHWLRQEPGSLITCGEVPAELAARIRALEATGCKVAIQSLDSDCAHVCLVAAQHLGRHFTTMGTAASASFDDAATKALEELETRVFAWLNGHRPSIRRAAQVVTTEHHFELYGLKPYFRRADGVLFPNALDTPSPRFLAEQRFDSTSQLIDRIAAYHAGPVVAVDITPQRYHIDQGRTPLVVVKALVAGMLPMSFGHRREPRGMVPRVHPASKFPHPFP